MFGVKQINNSTYYQLDEYYHQGFDISQVNKEIEKSGLNIEWKSNGVVFSAEVLVGDKKYFFAEFSPCRRVADWNRVKTNFMKFQLSKELVINNNKKKVNKI